MRHFVRVSIRTRWILAVHVLTLVVTASYVTLGIFDSNAAEELWAPYAFVTFFLAVTNLITYKRIRNGKKRTAH